VNTLRRHFAALAVPALGAVTGCSRSDAPLATRTFIYAQADTIRSFALKHSGWWSEAQFAPLVYEGLTGIDVDGGVRPALAERWESADLRTWTFQLRAGAQFHDGSRVTARDVLRAWRTALRDTTGGALVPARLLGLLGADAFAAGRADSLPGVRAVSDSVVEVTLREPIATLPYLLASDRAAVPAVADTPTHPLGSGPWRWISGRAGSGRIVLARNASYYGRQPLLDTLVFVAIHSDDARRAALIAGAVHASEFESSEVTHALRSRRDLGMRFSASRLMRTLSFNPSSAVLRDVRVRRALLQALDLGRIAERTAVERVMFAHGAVPVDLPGGDSLRPRVAYDPIAARAALAAAGFSPPGRALVLHLPVRPRSTHVAFLQLAAEYWRAVGVDVRMDAASSFRNEPDLADADVQTYFQFPGFADSEDYLSILVEDDVSATQPIGPGSAGTLRLLRQLRMTRDSAARASLARAIDDSVMASLATAPLWFAPSVMVHSLQFAGVQSTMFVNRFDSVHVTARAPGAP
jgi:ABC-type transport system substrate-binding protein